MNLRSLTRTPRGRIALAGGAGAAIGLVALVFKRDSGADGAPVPIPIDDAPPFTFTGPGPGFADGEPGYGWPDYEVAQPVAPTIIVNVASPKYPVAQVQPPTPGTPGLYQGIRKGEPKGERVIQRKRPAEPVPAPSAPARVPVAPTAPTTSHATHSPIVKPTPAKPGKPAPSISKGPVGFYRANGPVMFRNRKGVASVAKLSAAERQAIAAAEATVRKTHKGTHFHIHAARYWMNTQFNFERA